MNWTEVRGGKKNLGSPGKEGGGRRITETQKFLDLESGGGGGGPEKLSLGGREEN